MLSAIAVVLSLLIIVFTGTWYVMKLVADWVKRKLNRETIQEEVAELTQELGIGRNGKYH